MDSIESQEHNNNDNEGKKIPRETKIQIAFIDRSLDKLYAL